MGTLFAAALVLALPAVAAAQRPHARGENHGPHARRAQATAPADTADVRGAVQNSLGNIR